ncbi:pyridoxal phosphate-dependent transferase [Dactylonectria estremocensis]|uniref:Pyridoxal phosphate-dependent transferase n=1 Tax=Dactylonectria estremocensis TaxID=1079267 RepID=A0A9P9FBH7_9HYPO|nr:pyridoxal phosphate-dependent transferase [Dactylonectria estremocensis]
MALTYLGGPLPPGDRHAVSVYLPTWRDTVGWCKRDPELLALMKTGYPRFFVPINVRHLAERLIEWAATCRASKAPTEESTKLLAAPGRLALLTSGERYAKSCRRYLEAQKKGAIAALRISFSGAVEFLNDTPSASSPSPHEDIYAVAYPEELAAEAKAFWQHTGFGISSRCAEFWLDDAPFLRPDGLLSNGPASKVPLREAQIASDVLLTRIGGLISTEGNEVGVDAVYLHATGMASISHSATVLSRLRGNEQGVCRAAIFGFLYVDTFKVLSKVYGFDCKLYGHATPSDLDQLETDLGQGLRIDAMYTEFPGNPLLGSVDLERLYKLSKKHDFLLVVDDTVATSVNVSLISYCDVVCTSLTKLFSGGCNVMGGSVVLNPQSDKFKELQHVFAEQYDAVYFPGDVLVMEKNSAEFAERVAIASQNAERVSEVLREHSTVSEVFYPKGNPTQGVYERYKRPGKGYGYLLSVRFKQPEAAVAFHDALNVAKGPSLGTNFTLCCAYTLFAHFTELEWAAQYGVVEHLVRISVGIEEWEQLGHLVRTALGAAARVYT